VALLSRYGGSVVVPVGAETGACTIELNGRQIWGANCVVSKGLSGGGLPAQAPEHAAARAWKNYGEGSALLGTRIEPPDQLVPSGEGKSLEEFLGYSSGGSKLVIYGIAAVALILFVRGRLK